MARRISQERHREKRRIVIVCCVEESNQQIRLYGLRKLLVINGSTTDLEMLSSGSNRTFHKL
jgi:hypothetical protein